MIVCLLIRVKMMTEEEKQQFQAASERKVSKLEFNAVVRNKYRQEINEVTCRTEADNLMECGNQHIWPRMQCKPEFKLYNDCFVKYFYDPDFRKQVNKKYLEDRRKYFLEGGKDTSFHVIKN